MAIRAVVFDFGNVIGHFSREKAARQLAAFSRAGRPVEGHPLERVIADYLHDGELEDAFESGRLTPAEVLGDLCRRFDLCGEAAALALAYADMFAPNDEVCSLVPALQGRYRLLLLSNTNALHYPHFRRQFADTLDRFDALVASHEVGYRKPDPRIFRHAQALAGCDAGACLFIDDLPANVTGAVACGWKGIVYCPGGDLRGRLASVGVRA